LVSPRRFVSFDFRQLCSTVMNRQAVLHVCYAADCTNAANELLNFVRHYRAAQHHAPVGGMGCYGRRMAYEKAQLRAHSAFEDFVTDISL